MRIYLVRHGESQGNVDPSIHATMADHAIPLSARGREQARDAGVKLRAIFERTYASPDGVGTRPPIRLWASPYRRTRETADAISAEVSGWFVDRKEHILLCEQQFGLFDGIPDDQLALRFPAEYAHFEKHAQFEGRFWARMPLGESRFDVATRVHQCFGTLQRDAAAGIKDIVVVCHGVTMRAFLMMWCHFSPEWFEAEPNPRNCAVRLIEETGDRGYLFEGFAPERKHASVR